MTSEAERLRAARRADFMSRTRPHSEFKRTPKFGGPGRSKVNRERLEPFKARLLARGKDDQ